MKKLVAFLMMIALMGVFSANAQVPFADTGLNFERMEARLGVTADENGDFVAKSIKAQALENLFYEKIGNYAATGAVMFCVQVEGNRETGIAYPVLNILYAGSPALNTRYAVFAIGEDRYDVRVSSSAINMGRYRVETMKAYLTDAGFEMIKRMANENKISVALLGDNMYVQTAEKVKFYASVKNEIAAESLDALALPLGAPDYSDYPLGDIAQKTFEAKYGVETEITVSKVNEASAYELDKTFGLAGANVSAASVRDIQELLKKNGFMAGTTATTVNEGMIKAVRSAQAYYGLPVTGFADAKLINALSDGRAAAGFEEADEAAEYALDAGNVQLTLDKWWYAKRAETTIPGGGVTVSDKDNIFMVFDGSIASYATSGMSLSWEVKAEAVLEDKWAFPVSIYVEAQGGETLSTTLGVRRAGRLVMTCEIPEALMNEEGEWVIRIMVGDWTHEAKLLK